MTLRPSHVRCLILGCFFVSGGAALLYEVSWLRLLVLVFGTTGLAVATLLAAFMAGLALGSYWFGRLADRWPRPVLLYGLLEAGIGAYALAVPAVFEGLGPLYRWAWESFHPSFWAFSCVRFGLAFLALLVPTTLMGGTLPVLSRFFTRTAEDIGWRAGLVYSLNTVGSALGALATGFVLLPGLGVKKTILIGAAINALIAALALALARTAGGSPRPAQPEAPAVTGALGKVSGRARAALAVFSLSGLLAMTYEVAWTRVLTLVLGSSTYSFTVMVTTFILGIGLGSALTARPADRFAAPVAAFGLLQLGIGLTTVLGLHLAHRLPTSFLYLFQWTGGRSPLFVMGQFVLSALVMFLPTLLLGAVFPVVIRLVARDLAALGRAVGTAYAANTVGAVAGAVAGGFLLLPHLGIETTLVGAAILNLLAGAALFGMTTELSVWSRLRLAGAALGALALLLATVPRWDRLVMSSGVYREAPALLSLYASPKDALRLLNNLDLLFYREGVTATVTVVERPVLDDRRHVALAIDGKVDASSAEDMATQVLSAHLPLMLAPHVDRVLVVGWGSGVTVGSAELYPVRRLTAIEIEPAVVAGSRAFDAVNQRPLEDSRLRLIVEDARNYLLVAADTFDLIISEPSNPWMSGPAKLFTREFFQLGAAHLAPDGVFCQWVQLYGLEPQSVQALVRTFQGVFPHTYLVQTAAADLLLVASRRPLALDVPSLKRWFGDPKIARDLARVGVTDVAALLARVRLGPQETLRFAGHGVLNTDDNGLIEFSAPRAMYEPTIGGNLASIDAAAGSGVAAYLAGLTAPADEVKILLELASRTLRAGHAEETVAMVRRALALVPSSAGYWLLGDALSRSGDDAGAMDAWGRAVALDPGHVPSLLSRGRWLSGHGRWAAALADLRRATAAAPRDRGAWALRALIAWRLGRDVEARWALARSEGFAPSGGGGDLESLFLPYLAYRLNGRPADGRALTAFRQNLRALRQVLHWATGAPRSGAVDSLYDIVDQFFPRDQEVRRLLEGEVVRPLTAFYRGVSAYLLGFYAESIRLLDGLRRASGASLPLADYYVGLAYLRSGDEPAAIDALSRFLATVPPDRRRGPTVADAQRRLHEVLRASRAHPSAFRSGRLLPGYAETPGGNVAVTPTNTDTALLQRWRRTAAGKPQAPKPAAKRLSLV